jgi:flavin reductase (DIM6/NTAB) family NADH-FMN oxidoreductase RutF
MRIELSKSHRLLSPRTVTLITSKNKEGGINAAPVDFVSPASFSPPVLMVSLMPTRRTYKNILESGEFVVNILSKIHADQVLKCAARFPEGTNKLKAVGLHTYSSEKIRVPRIKEAKIWLECKVLEKIKIGDHVAIFGEILTAEAAEDIITGSEIDLEKLDPILHISKNKFITDFKNVKYRRYD